MRATPARAVVLPSAKNRIITPACPEFGAGGFLDNARAIASGPWVSANDPIAIPFRLSYGMIVSQVGWMNGSGTMTDSADVGVYDTSFNRLLSGGGTARAGVGAWQWVNITDVLLGPGKYYLAMSNNGVTANNQFFYSTSTSVTAMSFCGVFDSTTDAYPLPNPLTNMVAAATMTRVPICGLATRTPF